MKTLGMAFSMGRGGREGTIWEPRMITAWCASSQTSSSKASGNRTRIAARTSCNQLPTSRRTKSMSSAPSGNSPIPVAAKQSTHQTVLSASLEIRQTRRCAPKAIARGTKTKWSAPKSKSVTQTCTKCTPCAWWSKTSAYLRIVSSTWFPNLDLTKRETSTMRLQGKKKLVWIIKIRCSMVREWMATIRGSVDQWRTLLSTSGISTQCLLSILMKAYKEAKNYSRQTILLMQISPLPLIK